jgi:hypothetical protein
MTVTATHALDVVGFRITISAVAGPDETIQSITATMDGMPIDNKVFGGTQQSYTNSLRQQGGFTPGQSHVVTMSATNNSGQERVATDTWTD